KLGADEPRGLRELREEFLSGEGLVAVPMPLGAEDGYLIDAKKMILAAAQEGAFAGDDAQEVLFIRRFGLVGIAEVLKQAVTLGLVARCHDRARSGQSMLECI